MYVSLTNNFYYDNNDEDDVIALTNVDGAAIAVPLITPSL